MNRNYLQFLMLGIMLCVFVSSYGQHSSISGTVVSAQDSEPLVGVSVSVKGEATSVQTDANGKFLLAVALPNALVFTYMGFTPKEVAVETSTALTIVLEPENSMLSEVVVVGYGTQKKS